MIFILIGIYIHYTCIFFVSELQQYQWTIFTCLITGNLHSPADSVRIAFEQF